MLVNTGSFAPGPVTFTSTFSTITGLPGVTTMVMR
jgi:hypothetical protein